MTPKKVHEVEMFSQCVNETVGDLSRQIVDVGSGLGYVSQASFKPTIFLKFICILSDKA